MRRLTPRQIIKRAYKAISSLERMHEADEEKARAALNYIIRNKLGPSQK